MKAWVLLLGLTAPMAVAQISPPVGSTAYPGVTSDSANGLAVAGNLVVGTAVTAPVVTVTGTPTNPTDAATVAYVGAHSGGGGTAKQLAAYLSAGNSSQGIPLNGGAQIDGVGAFSSGGVLAASYGLLFIGDSNTAGFGVTAGQDYASLMAADLGGATKSNYAISGDNWADCAYRAMTHTNTADFGNPVQIITCGTNNSRFSPYPVPASYSQAAQQEMAAAFLKMATSTQNDQLYFSNGTIWAQTSGSWTKEMPWFLFAYAAGHTGGTTYCEGDILSLGATGMQFTVHTNAPTGGTLAGGAQINLNGDAMTVANSITTSVVSSPNGCSGTDIQVNITALGQVPILTATGAGSVTTSQAAEVMTATTSGVLTASIKAGPTGTIAVTYPIGPAYGGSFQVLINGVAATDLLTGTSTFSEAWTAGNEILPNNAPNNAMILLPGGQGAGAKAVIFTGLTPGTTYTVAISVVSGKIGVSHLTSPHGVINFGNNSPNAGVGGTIVEKNNAQATNVTAWNSLTANTVQTLRTQMGLGLTFVNLNDGLDPSIDLIDSGSAIRNCQPNTDTSHVHLAFGSCGHTIVAREFEQALKLVPAQFTAKQFSASSSTLFSSNASMPVTGSVILFAGTTQTFTFYAPVVTNQTILIQNVGAGSWTVACNAGVLGCGSSIPASIPGTIAGIAIQGGSMWCTSTPTTWRCMPGSNGFKASNSATYEPNLTNCSTVGGCTVALYTEYMRVTSTVGAGSTITFPAINTLQTDHPVTIDNISGFALALSIPSSGTVPSTLGIGCTLTLSIQNQASNVYRVLGSSCPLYTGTTETITGTALTSTCDSGTATVTGAATGDAVSVSSTTGADVGGAFDLRASVTSANTVTVYVCGTGTPASLTYNVVVHKMHQ